jgi:Domain of unknown function (DUF4856)
MQNLYKNLLILCALALLSACGKDEENTSQDYNIPTSYDFENVSYSGQEQRLAMLTELSDYMKTANVANTALDAARLQAMYVNDATLANWTGTYELSKQMKDKTLQGQQETFENLLADLATASQSTVSAAPGVAGVATSQDGAKNYLLNERGVELGQVISKGLMGALLYYQATAVYFGSEKMNVDNNTVTTGEGTEMEHHWDEAFGYFGVPKAFPSDTEPLYFWGKYCHDRDAIMGTNKLLMDAFLKGRAAISNKDITSRDEAIEEASAAWEKVVVGSAMHYLNNAIADFDDVALRMHHLSEAAGFIYALQFNPKKQYGNVVIESFLEDLTGAFLLSSLHLYNTTLEDIALVRDNMAVSYGLENIKTEL